MYIKLIRLTDGSFAIGKEESNLFKDVLQVSLTPEKDGIKIGVVPMLYPLVTNHTGMSVDKKFVVCVEDCPNNLLNIYMQATSTIMSVPTLENV